MNTDFTPDYRHMLEVMANRRPARFSLYEHIISPAIMEKILDVKFADMERGGSAELKEFFTHYCEFFRRMTYDTVSYEVCIVDILPDHGALMGGRPGPIQSFKDLEAYPWADIPNIFWRKAMPLFDALASAMPPGMKAIGGVGNGVFEISEDLVGYEYLCCMIAEEPELVAELYRRIGSLMLGIWKAFLERYSDSFAVCRFGDDLGFKSSMLLSPATIRQHILPQYARIIDLVHEHQKPFLWHSCGNIFPIMDDMIALGIQAKHSNEDVIAPYSQWISSYSDRIALLGGIDLDVLCTNKPDDVFQIVLERARENRLMARGYALGSGNSIPEYVPVEGYLAMVRAAKALRLEPI